MLSLAPSPTETEASSKKRSRAADEARRRRRNESIDVLHRVQVYFAHMLYGTFLACTVELISNCVCMPVDQQPALVPIRPAAMCL